MAPSLSRLKEKFITEPLRLARETTQDFRATVVEVMTQPRRGTEYNVACRQRLNMFAYVAISVLGIAIMIVGIGFAFCVPKTNSEEAAAAAADAAASAGGVVKRGIESASNAEMMWNTVSFGILAYAPFVARM